MVGKELKLKDAIQVSALWSIVPGGGGGGTWVLNICLLHISYPCTYCPLEVSIGEYWGLGVFLEYWGYLGTECIPNAKQPLRAEAVNMKSKGGQLILGKMSGGQVQLNTLLWGQ